MLEGELTLVDAYAGCALCYLKAVRERHGFQDGSTRHAVRVPPQSSAPSCATSYHDFDESLRS